MKVVGKIFAILYSILFTPVMLILILIFTVSGYFKSNFYTDLISNDFLKKTKISEISTNFDVKQEITELCGEDCTIEGAIIAIASKEYGVDEKLVKEALNDSDIQKAIGDFLGTFISLQTTGEAKKLNYNIFDKALKKEVSKEILRLIGYTNEEFKQIIKEYNESVDDFNSYEGGYENVQKYLNY